MIERILSVVFGNCKEASRSEALIKGIGEGVTNPCKIGLAGTIIEGQDEDDAAACVGWLGGGLRQRWKGEQEQESGQLTLEHSTYLRGPCHRLSIERQCIVGSLK